MIVAQMTLSIMLLVVAGLFTKSLVNISRAELGIQVDHLVTFSLQPRLNGYTREAARDLFERTESALLATPGVTSASASTIPLIGGGFSQTRVNVDGFSGPPEARAAVFTSVGPRLFQTVGIPLLAGRMFTEADAAGAPKVAIVNEAFAKKFGLSRDIIGRRMTERSVDVEIVGLVGDAKYSQVKEDAQPEYFIPYRQDDAGSASFYVRTPLDPASMLRTIPTVMAGLDRNLPVLNPRTMEDQVRQNTSGDRVVAQLSAGFAALATLLAAIGLYGVLAYTVTLRAREFGVRMALGAAPGQVLQLVLRHVARLAGIGAIIGSAGALGVGRLLQSQLYHLRGYDPVVFILALIVLSLVALAAGFVPAWRASRLDPVQALRAD
jgi:predicted permease